MLHTTFSILCIVYILFRALHFVLYFEKYMSGTLHLVHKIEYNMLCALNIVHCTLLFIISYVQVKPLTILLIQNT